MQHLALCNRGGGIGKDRQHAHVIRLGHQLEAAREKVIAHQHRRFVIPQQVGRRPPATLRAFIDHIVVQQGRGVNEFYRGGKVHVVGAVIAAQTRRSEGQHRAQPLAACLYQMGRDLGDARRMFRRHAVADQIVHRGHIRVEIGRHPVMWFLGVFARHLHDLNWKARQSTSIALTSLL